MTDSEETKPEINPQIILTAVRETARAYLIEYTESTTTKLDQLLKLIGGDGIFNDLAVSTSILSREIGFKDLEEKIDVESSSLEKILREKGYRANLLTYKEHRKIGSTVWQGYSSLPDTPIGILDKEWNIESGERLTIDEARRGRELEKMPTINDEGIVTGVIISLSDTYHFLSNKRKLEIRKLEEHHLSNLRNLLTESYKRKHNLFSEFEKTIERFLNGEFTITEISEQASKLKKIVGTSMHDFFDHIDQARQLSYRLGNRDCYLTPQEIFIFGRQVDQKYFSNPWTPLGIQDGLLSLDQARKIRQEEGKIRWVTDAFLEWAIPFEIVFENIDIQGQTVCGPLGNDQKLAAAFKERVKKIPYARPCDWYYKPS